MVLCLFLYFGTSCTEKLEEVSVRDNTNVENLKETYVENIALSKINLYAVVFINLYIIAFIILVFYCTRCCENNKHDRRNITIEDGVFEDDAMFPVDYYSQRSTNPLITTYSAEPFETDWVNYENIYENTYT